MNDRPVRYAIGLLISAVAIWITLARVDLADVADAVVEANPGPLLVAVVIVGVELLVRAVRWRMLLRPMRALPYAHAVAYLSIGYFANSVLPARLGDLTRAYLAGTAFGIRRTSTLGTILVERVSDGMLMLAVVILLGLVVPGGGDLVLPAITLAAIGVGALILLAMSVAGVRRSPIAATRGWAVLERVLARLAEGTLALRHPAGIAGQLGLTLLGFGLAVAILLAVGRSLGMSLSLAEGALVTAGLALSLAVPAGPASVGTYELVGLTILNGLGQPAGPALATVVIHHAVVAVPPTLAGMVAMWLLHIRVTALPSRGDEVGSDADRPMSKHEAVHGREPAEPARR